MPFPRFLATLSFTLIAGLASPTWGQTAPLEQVEVAVDLQSGAVTSTSDQRAAVWTDVVQVPDAPWLRLIFDEASLGAAPQGGEPTMLRITSFRDGAVQFLDATHLEQWQHTSAYFNGDAVMIEVIADPNAAPSHVTISTVWAGVSIDAQSICGSVDDRELSDDPRVGRKEPSGCTAWLIDDVNHCFLTAGHCTGNRQVVEFNVPLSNSNGNPQHPGPEDQYAVDPVSLQFQSAGIGSDWGYFGCFANTNTGLKPHEAQGGYFVLSAAPPPVTGQDIRITGYGTTQPPVDPQWDGAQKTHTGPYVGAPGTQVDYQTDTTGGNSGSPVINEATGEAIGIHTHGGCNSSGANHGTAIDQGSLQAALANPQGICRPAPPNDECHDAFAIGLGFTLFDSTWATTTAFPDNLCSANGDSQVWADVWYLFTAPCDGEVTADLCGSSFNTRLAVYTLCPTAANLAIACDDDSSCSTTSVVTWTATQGLTYVLRIGGFQGASGTGGVDLAMTECVDTPPNDTCGTAAFLGDGVSPFSTVNASTNGPTEPGVCGPRGSDQVDHDIWYRYVASCDGDVTIALCNADYDTRLAVYTSSCPSESGLALNCDDTTCAGRSEVTFAATSGVVYRVRVGGNAGGQMGSGDIEVSCGMIVDCPGDTNGDAQVNVDDLNNVILDWGTDGSANGGDLTGPLPGSPPDGTVDVNDLNAVIVGWGVCS